MTRSAASSSRRIPPGLDDLTECQSALCEFFALTDEILAPARHFSSARPKSDEVDWETAVDALTTDEMRDFLVRAAAGDATAIPKMRNLLRHRSDTGTHVDPVVTDRSIDDYWQAVHDGVDTERC